MKKIVQNILGLFDMKLSRKSNFENMLRNSVRNSGCVQDLGLLKAVAPELRSQCIDMLDKSKSQLRQDLFVLSELDFKESGYFVEFGAANGIHLSNSYLLEKEFKWNGLLAEPARMWHKELQKNRSGPIETRCVWKKSGQTLKFNEAEIGELSTIDDFSDKDAHSKARETGTRYDVETISFLELLETHNAPKVIDYLSIDTEGSEYIILKDFDFDRYQFKVITCEHNHTPMREKVYELLTRHGYKRKFESLSKFDDWYINTKFCQ